MLRLKAIKARKAVAYGVVALATGTLPAMSMAEIYQWRDEQGRVHFSDKKPENASAKDISDTLTPANVDQGHQHTQDLRGAYRGKTDAEIKYEQRKAYQQEEARHKLQVYCDKARRRLETLQGPVYFEREDGSTYTVSEKEREKMAQDYRAKVRKHCGNN